MFTLDQVVPWGRSFDEYVQMFSLSEAELGLRILGCGDGPASFNAEGTRRGVRVVSVDPIYRWKAYEIEQQIGRHYDEVLDQARRNANDFVWKAIPSVDALGEVRMAAMRAFLADFPAGKRDGRY